MIQTLSENANSTKETVVSEVAERRAIETQITTEKKPVLNVPVGLEEDLDRESSRTPSPALEQHQSVEDITSTSLRARRKIEVSPIEIGTSQQSPLNPHASPFTPSSTTGGPHPAIEELSPQTPKPRQKPRCNYDDLRVACELPGCKKVPRSFDEQSVICPWCGPFSLTRYCTILHLLADVGDHFYSGRCSSPEVHLPVTVRKDSLNLRHLNPALSKPAIGPGKAPSDRHLQIMTAYKGAGIFEQLAIPAWNEELQSVSANVSASQ
ncbi:MAG: hypothetical protein Q9227_008566 [Pyrenula ochraceoflavens]